MGLFDADDALDKFVEESAFESSYKSIADKFRSKFDLPIPLLIEDNDINLDKDLKFSPKFVNLDQPEILFYDLSTPINQDEFHQLMDLAFLWTIEGIILSNIDNIDPSNSGAQRLIIRILTEEDMSGKATFYGNPLTFLQFPSHLFVDRIDKDYKGSKKQVLVRKTGRIKVALICKEVPEYLKDKNTFCSKILMDKK